MTYRNISLHGTGPTLGPGDSRNTCGTPVQVFVDTNEISHVSRGSQVSIEASRHGGWRHVDSSLTKSQWKWRHGLAPEMMSRLRIPEEMTSWNLEDTKRNDVMEP